MKLGPIPFPPGYQPYTPPERRRRKRRRLKNIQSGGGTSGSRRTLTAGRGGTTKGWVSIDPDGGTDYVPFLGVQRTRIRGALGASLVSHALALTVILLIIRSAPITEEVVDVERTNYDIVWIPQEGFGGGGGGGGNESLEMPRQVEVVGEDNLNVPVEVPERSEEVEAPPEPPPLEAQNIQLSALPMAAAPQARTGVLDGLMARAESAGSGTDGGAGDGDDGGIGAGQGDGLGAGQGGGSGGGVYRPGNGVETPRLLREVTPKYTAEAMRAKVQGVVLVEAVVRPDGSVGDVTVVRSLDRNFGLDEEAIKAAKQWRFQPGTRFGKPVAVLVTIELSFTLR